MKNRLFWRLFWAFLATLMVTVSVLSLLMVFMVRAERRNTLESELLVQARDVALLMRQGESLWLWRADQKLGTAIEQKIDEIRQSYDASVWLVNATGTVMVIGPISYTSDQLNDEKVIEQIMKVLSGEEIRVQGLIPELGEDVVTIGVPLSYADGRVYGAVLLHISTDHLQVDYSDMIRNACVAGIVSLILGTALAYWIARRQTLPLKKIQDAVTDFSAGKLDRRVEIEGSDEMAQLAVAINRMAQDLSTLEESRRSFVANVSHELRSPLTCMQGYAQGLLDGTIAPEERDKYLNVVLSETKRLTKLVNELLDLSRFESGKIPLSLSVFDVNDLIAVELFKFEGRIDEKHIDVEVNFHEQQCFVGADADRIRQVITNLVDNAVKFLRENGRLIVETYAVDDLCYVNISNDGPAIPPEDLPFVFDRFYKADKAHTSGMGTGLGLSIVKLILTQHWQKIRVTSNPSMTTFSFTLRRADPPRKELPAKQEDEAQ